MGEIKIYFVAFAFIISWLIKGLVWIIFDILVLKNTYNNILKTLITMIIWPIASFKATYKWIKTWLNKGSNL